MYDIGVTRLSSKGQLVIPREMRAGFKGGDKFVVVRSGDRFVLKSVKGFGKNIEGDLRFAERTEQALKRYEAGRFKKMSGDEFLKELEKW